MQTDTDSWLEFFYCPNCGGQNMAERRSDGLLYLVYSDCDLCGEEVYENTIELTKRLRRKTKEKTGA